MEGLWDQTQDVTCNRHFADLDQLEEALTRALRPFWETPARVVSLVHHWLHTQANATACPILPELNEKWYYATAEGKAGRGPDLCADAEVVSPSGTKPARGERFKTGHSEGWIS